MTRDQIAALDAQAQELYKRVTEWWTYDLGGEPKKAARAQRAVNVLVERIAGRLTTLIGPAEAGWFRRAKAYEPCRAMVAKASVGNWINEAWHRKDRLEEILIREERALREMEAKGGYLFPPGEAARFTEKLRAMKLLRKRRRT